jgi:hypothetical protein
VGELRDEKLLVRVEESLQIFKSRMTNYEVFDDSLGKNVLPGGTKRVRESDDVRIGTTLILIEFAEVCEVDQTDQRSLEITEERDLFLATHRVASR